MSGDEHEEGHNRHGRTRDGADDGQPYEEIAKEALDGSGEVDQPGASAGGGGIADGGVKETGENAGVGADVLEDGYGVKGGLIVFLGGFEDRRVDTEGVGCAAAALNPYARHRRYPFAAAAAEALLHFRRN